MVKTFKFNALLPLLHVATAFDQCTTVIVQPHVAWNSHVKSLFS